ncbi:hypothetical protein EDB86DRAFT_2839264 [Lactarius hatsudake]|nr:hypothetical protein EDB86DRAFT_2839264 [Lactarius hatsudake]
MRTNKFVSVSMTYIPRTVLEDRPFNASTHSILSTLQSLGHIAHFAHFDFFAFSRFPSVPHPHAALVTHTHCAADHISQLYEVSHPAEACMGHLRPPSPAGLSLFDRDAIATATDPPTTPHTPRWPARSLAPLHTPAILRVLDAFPSDQGWFRSIDKFGGCSKTDWGPRSQYIQNAHTLYTVYSTKPWNHHECISRPRTIIQMTRPQRPKNEISGPNSQIVATTGIAGQRASWTWSWTSTHKSGLGFRNELDATFQGLYHFDYGVAPSYTELAIGFQSGLSLGNKLEALARPMEICYGVTSPRAPSCTTSNLLFSPDATDLDVGMVHGEDISASDDKPMPPILHDPYCFICGNGGALMMCNSCSRSICIGSDTQCLDLPATSRYQDEEVSFICPACHQDRDRKINKPTPYFGFYVSQEHQTKGRDHEPIYQHPAKVRGSAQVIPRSKYQNDGVAILNFRLKSFNRDTGDLGKILEPFAATFFPNEGDHSLLFENIDFDLTTRGLREHRKIIERVQENLRAATSTLKTVIVLITTHSEKDTGQLGTSSTHHVNINNWMTQVITRPILDMIHAFNTHWFLLCCGALVNVPTSLDGVRSFSNEWKPANLFAFDAPAFHPIYAATFLLNFFQHIVIEGRSFDSAVGLLLNTSALSRHTGIKRFWSRGSVVNTCWLRWTHLRTQPWGNAVPHQCQGCGCIQSWNQKVKGPSTELPRDDVSMRCSYRGSKEPCQECLIFEKPETPFKAIKLTEGVCMAVATYKKVVAAVWIVARLPVMRNTSQRIGLFATIVQKNAFTIFPINAHKAETDHKKLIFSSEFIVTEISDANTAAEGRGVAELITRFEGRKYSLWRDNKDGRLYVGVDGKPVTSDTQSVKPHQRMEAENPAENTSITHRVWYGRYESKPGLTQTDRRRRCVEICAGAPADKDVGDVSKDTPYRQQAPTVVGGY